MLQLAHHAGSDSNSKALLDTEPSITVFTGGENDVDEDTRERHDPTYSTYDNGDVEFVIDEQGRLLGPDEEVFKSGEED